MTNNFYSRAGAATEQAKAVQVEISRPEGEPFTQIPTRLLNHLSLGALRLLGELKTLLWGNDRPTTASLAARLGQSIGHTQRHLRELEAAGAITRDRERGRRKIRLTLHLARRKGDAPIARQAHAPIARQARHECGPLPIRDFKSLIPESNSSSSLCGMTREGDDDEGIQIYPIPSVSESRDRAEVEAHVCCAEHADPLVADCLPRKSHPPQVPPSPPEQAEALCITEEFFGSTLATELLRRGESIERDARKRGLEVGVAWNCLRAAVIMAAIRADKGKLREESPIGYVLVTYHDYLDRRGVPDEVAELESKLRARKRQATVQPILDRLYASMWVDTAPQLVAKCNKLGYAVQLSKCGNWIRLFPIEGVEQRLTLDELRGFAHTVTDGRRSTMLPHLRAEAQP